MRVNIGAKKIKEVLTRGVENIFPSPEKLKKTMLSGKRLKLYCGYDPSTPTLHIGHAITIKKLAQFQALGHEVIMLIGDFTGMIGDPTEKLAVRKKLTREEVLRNSKNYKKLAGKILKFSGPNPAKILYNSKWNDKLAFIDLIELSSHFTVQQMIARDMFQKRIKQKKPIYLHEFLYPLAQAYDSVAMDVDLEVGGNDQMFNMLCGRDLMRAVRNKEKFVLTTKLLVGPTGKKMGKTEGNVVNIDDKPTEIYGKIMAWSDALIILGFELCTDLALDEIAEISNKIKKAKLNPREAKARLAKEIVTICYNKKTAKTAEEEFNRIFKEKKIPSKIRLVAVKDKFMDICSLLTKTNLASSKTEARRLISQGGVKIDGKVKRDWREKIEIKKGQVAQVGKRKFIRIK